MNATRRVFPMLNGRAFSSTARAPLARMTIIGRLAAEPESIQTSNDRELVRYTLGTSSGPRENRQTSWFNVVCFDEGARKDYLLSLPKGTLMHIDADAKMASFETSEGVKTTRLNLVQRSLEVLSRPRTENTEPHGQSAAEES